jgi:hypothetical protein
MWSDNTQIGAKRGTCTDSLSLSLSLSHTHTHTHTHTHKHSENYEVYQEQNVHFGRVAVITEAVLNKAGKGSIKALFRLY